MSIMQIAQIVKKVVEREYNHLNSIKISKIESDDLRSYHINSDKIKEVLNFHPKYTVEDAVKGLCDSYKNNLIPNSMNNDIYYNVKRLKNIQAN